jgi:hypothetical protein
MYSKSYSQNPFIQSSAFLVWLTDEHNRFYNNVSFLDKRLVVKAVAMQHLGVNNINLVDGWILRIYILYTYIVLGL